MLSEHLAHWDIRVGDLLKTDKTMAELEVSLNESHDWTRIAQDGKVSKIYHPSFCYCADLTAARSNDMPGFDNSPWSSSGGLGESRQLLLLQFCFANVIFHRRMAKRLQ